MPTSVVFCGREYIFHSDFREWMRYECLLTDGDVPEWERARLAAELIFPPELHVPLTKETACFLTWFYRGGKQAEGNGDEESGEDFLETRLPYRFEADFPLIYAAFLELYGIDLISIPYLHWWKFRSLFLGLHDCKFCEVVGYRTADTSEMSEKMKERYETLQEAYALPISITARREIERARAFLEN
ncbi:MAG: Gp15 family bacteriophage protein [Huintestinicola sp.]